jgi:hypothetical protein
LLPQRKWQQLWRHLFCCSKTKIEGDDSIAVVAFRAATKKRLAIAKKATTVLWSPFLL